MVITIRKHKPTVRVISLIAITCITTLFLFFGSLAAHVPSLSPFSLAHAATTCASTNGSQQDICEQQNPVTQGCTHDSNVLELESVYTTQNTLIGNVSLLHSPTCKTYWVRTTAYANTQQVEAIDAIISFHTGKVEDSKKTVSSNGKKITAITNMLFILPSVIPGNWAGKFFLKGQTQPITIPL